MTTRSILLGCLGLVTLPLGGCFEDPPPPIDDSVGSDTMSEPTAGTTAAPTTETTTPVTATDSTTGTTTVEPTTTPLDTTADGTTSEMSATDSTDSTSSTDDPCTLACDGLACGTADACECGECGPMATCSADETYCGMPVGYSNDFGDVAMLNPQLQFGHRFTVFAPTTVRRLGVISGGAGPQVRLALYDHDGTGPANRLVQTGGVMLYANGANEFEVGATPIAPGDYWVMMHTDVSTSFTRTFDLMMNFEVAFRPAVPFAEGFPVAMEDEMVFNDYAYNLYMIVEE
jgi:hypothetical protein